MALDSLFPSAPPDYRRMADEAAGMAAYARTVTSIMRDKVTREANPSMAEGMAALNGARATVTAPGVAAFEEAKQLSDQIRSGVVKQGLDAYTEGVNIGKELGALVSPRKRKVAAASNAVPDVGGSVAFGATDAEGNPLVGTVAPGLLPGIAGVTAAAATAVLSDCPPGQLLTPLGCVIPPGVNVAGPGGTSGVSAESVGTSGTATVAAGIGQIEVLPGCFVPGQIYDQVVDATLSSQIWKPSMAARTVILPPSVLVLVQIANPPGTGFDLLWARTGDGRYVKFFRNLGVWTTHTCDGFNPTAAQLQVSGCSLRGVDGDLCTCPEFFGDPACAGAPPPPPPPPPECPPGTTGVYPNCTPIPGTPTCPAGMHWDAARQLCVSDIDATQCCPPVNIPPCPTLEIPKKLIDCLCDISAAIAKAKKLETQSISFLTASAGRTSVPGDLDENWSGEPEETALLGDDPPRDQAFDRLPVIAVASLPPIPPVNGSGAGGEFGTQSLGNGGGGYGLNGTVPPGFNLGDAVNLFNLNWNEPDVCKGVITLRQTAGALKVSYVLQWLGVLDSNGEFGFLAKLYDQNPGALDVGAKTWRAFVRAVGAALSAAVRGLDALIAQVSVQAIGAAVAVPIRAAIDAVSGALNRWLGVDLTTLTTALMYTVTALAPTQIPSAADATSAFLRGQIDYGYWQCLVMANNQLPGPAEKVMLSLQARLNEGDLLRAWLRGLLDPERGNPDDASSKARNDAALLDRLRQRGWLERDAAEIMKGLTRVVPGPADLIRFMLKDVEDANIVKKFGLYDEFNQKYKGTLLRWFKDQGVPDNVALYEWAAHWQNMPWTQLQEMKFRLRPDKYGARVDPKGYPYVVNDLDLFDALGQNDIPPFWRYKLMEVSYRLPRLIDVRRAYFQGVVNDEFVLSDLLDRGNSPDTAASLLGVYQRLRRDFVRRSRIVRLYQTDSVGEDQARQLLAGEGYQPGEIQDAIVWADIEASAAVTRRCVRQIQARFTRGEIPRTDLPGVLAGFGFSAKQIARVVQSVSCTLATKPKDLTAAQICDFNGRGILSNDEALARLLRLGYSEDDAARMFAQCQNKQGEKAAKVAAKAAKDEAKKHKPLTQGQILRLAVKGEITPADATQRLIDRGLTADDAMKLVAAALAKKV